MLPSCLLSTVCRRAIFPQISPVSLLHQTHLSLLPSNSPPFTYSDSALFVAPTHCPVFYSIFPASALPFLFTAMQLHPRIPPAHLPRPPVFRLMAGDQPQTAARGVPAKSTRQAQSQVVCEWEVGLEWCPFTALNLLRCATLHASQRRHAVHVRSQAHSLVCRRVLRRKQQSPSTYHSPAATTVRMQGKSLPFANLTTATTTTATAAATTATVR